MKYLILLLTVTSLFFVIACSSESNAELGTNDQSSNQNGVVEQSDYDVDGEELALTIVELSNYDGQDGRPAYIAVDGKIYDVTNHPQWRGGSHRGSFEAGKDYSVEIREIPRHGTNNLDQAPIVGIIVD